MLNKMRAQDGVARPERKVDQRKLPEEVAFR